MSSFRSTSFLLFLALAGVLTAQQRPRINQRVDSTRLTRLGQTTHPLTRTGRDLGRAAADLPMERIQMQLSSSPEQEAALAQLLADQHDPASPHFQEWLTPEQFGERFGPAQQDIDAIVAWLQDAGFQVDEVGRGRRTLEFSGTASQVERAFHTEMRHYQVDGERHVANATDLSIPEALAAVIGGVASLHDFRHQPMHQVLGQTPAPATNLNGGSLAGRTNIKLSDVALFRSTFGLPVNAPQVIVNGKDPGVVSAGEEMEADLDVEWSGGVAKGATIKLVVSASTNASDGVDLSDQYIVNNNVAPVMSVSFGACEASMGSGNQFYNSLWQQAAAQGISVFVAAGDSGSAGCDSPGSTAPASHGFGVNGLASTPNNVAVGGTEFADTANPAAYWNANNGANKASAIGYIPETAWNESSHTTATATTNNLYAGSGGVSSVYPNPSWQTAPGVPSADPGAANQHHRYLPDVSLTAAGHDGYLVYREGGLYLVGGTSASSPSFAGLMAIVDQYTGGRNGNPNTRFYSLATQTPAAFHDITSGSNAVPCAGGSPGCSTAAPAGNVGKMNGYSAAAGYDLATGLGSADAYTMALNWGARPPAGPIVSSLSPNPMTGSATAQTLTINGSGFLAGAKATATSGNSSSVLATTFVSATQLQAAITTGTAVATWTITVANTTGPASNLASLSVVAPPAPPVVASVTPNPLTGANANQIVTINGSGFVNGTGLKVLMGYSGGATTTLTGAQIEFVSSTQILALIDVGATARTWTVQVVNPNGTASNIYNLPVVAPPVPPAIASLSPNPMNRSSAAQTLTIKGSGFQTGSGLKVVLTTTGASLTATGTTIQSASASQILATVSVGASARNWTVQVVNPNGTVSNTAILQVK
ncbi:MAG: protease pro-enzyme activation domain-containing protein [Candidatus Solibacter sp.]